MLKVAIIGCGRIIEEGHAPAFEALSDEVQVVAIADPSAERLAEVGNRLNVSEDARYTDYRDMLKEQADAVDLVDLALPHFLHEEVTITCVEAGVDIFTEKPLAPTVEAAKRMLQKVDAAGVKLAVAHNYYYRQHVVTMREAIRTGRIGDPFLVRSEGIYGSHWSGASGYNPAWRTQGARSGGGALLDNGYHNVYVAEALMGTPVVAVTGRVGQFVNQQDVDDTAVALLDHGEGRTTSLQVGWSVRGGAQPVEEVHGTGGSLRFVNDVVEIYENSVGQWQTLAEVGRPTFAFEGLFGDLFDSLRDGVVPEHLQGKAALHNLAVIRSVYLASEEDRRVLVNELEGA